MRSYLRETVASSTRLLCSTTGEIRTGELVSGRSLSLGLTQEILLTKVNLNEILPFFCLFRCPGKNLYSCSRFKGLLFW